MIDIINIIVNQSDVGERIDKVIVLSQGYLSRSAAQKLIEEGNIIVNGNKIPKNYKVNFGDNILMLPVTPKILEAIPEDIPLDIRYEDSDLLVVNKQKGMVVHPAAGNFDGTLVNALLSHCEGNLSGINGVIRPGIVHRIDKDTSGLLIVAKNDFAHKNLAQQIKEHSFKREYRTVVVGHLKEQKGIINVPIGRSTKNRQKQAVTDKNSKNAITHYEVLEEFTGYSYIKLHLETGRTHQIRVHMSYLGHPVAGDSVYGGKRANDGLDGQCLHAGLIGFLHPRTNEYIEITSELPVYFEDFLRRIAND